MNTRSTVNYFELLWTLKEPLEPILVCVATRQPFSRCAWESKVSLICTFRNWLDSLYEWKLVRNKSEPFPFSHFRLISSSNRCSLNLSTKTADANAKMIKTKRIRWMHRSFHNRFTNRRKSIFSLVFNVALPKASSRVADVRTPPKNSSCTEIDARRDSIDSDFRRECEDAIVLNSFAKPTTELLPLMLGKGKTLLDIVGQEKTQCRFVVSSSKSAKTILSMENTKVSDIHGDESGINYWGKQILA